MLKKLFIHKTQRFYVVKSFLYMWHLIKKNEKKPTATTYKVIKTFLTFNILNLFTSTKFLIAKILNTIRMLPLVLVVRQKVLCTLPFLKKNYYEVPYPKNTNAKSSTLFKNKNYYYLKPSRLRKIKNNYLYIETYYGIVHKKYSIINDSIHGKYDKRNIKILRPYNKIAFENYVKAAFKNGEQILHSDTKNNYLHIHHWFNYYHWLTESLPRLLIAIEKKANYTIVLPESLKNIAFVQDSLSAFSNIDVVYFPDYATVFFKELNFVSIKKYCDNYDPLQLKLLRELLLKHVVNNKVSPPVNANRIFINRQLSGRRTIINNKEVEELLQRYDVQIINFEDYNFFEQIAIANNCRFLIGAHGSGLTNMMFMEKGARVFELHKKVENKYDHHSTVYWRMAGVLSHTYYCQFCDTEPQDDDIFTTSIYIDVELFEKNLKLFFTEE